MNKVNQKLKVSKKRKAIIKVIAFLLVISVLALIYGNFKVDVEHINISTTDLTESFDGFKIAHISDYHNRKSSLVNKQIYAALNSEKPDIIVVTGDVIDCRFTDIEVALEFLEKLCEYAPVYCVMGNHEANLMNSDKVEFEKLYSGIEALDIDILHSEHIKIELPNGEYFNLFGIADPYFFGGYEQINNKSGELCSEFNFKADEFNVLLAHHPEPLHVYSTFDIDLVFSGHAHGGQITLFGKAVLAPDQPIFPPYTSGVYKRNETQLVLSRGIGNSVIPLRVFSKPHLIITELNIP